MNRLKLFTMATLVALAFTACDEAEVVVPPPPPPTPVGTIGGVVQIEGAGAAGITVTLSSGASTTTAAGGIFGFTGVEAGSYSVSISGFPSDVTFANTTQLAAITSDGQVVQVTFSGNYIRTSSIVGAVVVTNRAGMHMMGMGMDGVGGLDGVTVRLGGEHAMGESTRTANAGQFAFTGLRAGTYTVTLSGLPSNVSFAESSASVSVGVGEVAQVNDFLEGTEYYEEGTLRGRLYIDGNENDVYEMNVDGVLELDSVTVTLEGGTVGMNVTAMTDSTGTFEFTYLEEGSYRVWIDAKDPHLKDENVALRGAGRSAPVTVSGNQTATAHFGFDVQEFTAMVPVVYGNDDGTENPAGGVEVKLWTQPESVSGRKQIGKTAKSDSTTGIASIKIARANLKDLPAKSIVFAEVQDPAEDVASTSDVNENDRDPVDDEVVTFTLDKSQFSTMAPEDHNLLWRNIDVIAHYVDQNGKPVLKGLTADTDPTIPFLGDFWYQAPKATAWTVLPSNVQAGDRNDVDPDRISDKKSAHNGAYQLKLSLSQVGIDSDTADANVNNNPAYGTYGVVDVTNITGQTLTFREKGAAEDSARSDVSVVEAKGSKSVKYSISNNTFTGTASRALVSAAVDGSSKEVNLGNFVVSYPHPNVQFTVFREKNDIPGYQDAKAHKARPDSLGLEAPTTEMAFSLRFTGAGLDDDSYGTISCTQGEGTANVGRINCPNAPAKADSWTLIAAADVTDAGAPVDVDTARVRFMPVPYAQVQTHADSSATAVATGPVTNTMYNADIGTLLEALVGAKVPGVLGWKYQNQTMTFDVRNRTAVAPGTSVVADADAAAVANLTVTAVLDSTALGYNAARDTVITGKTGDNGTVTFDDDLLEGMYTVTITKDGAKPARTIRAVMYKKGKRTGVADAIGYAQKLRVSQPSLEDLTNVTSAHAQEVEFQGKIAGYVFNAANDDAIVSTFETLGSGYMVMAQKMKPGGDANNCAVPDGTDNRKKDGDPMTIATDDKGMYTFALWEGCYDIMMDTTHNAQPKVRKGFTVSETTANLTRNATQAFDLEFDDGNADTDFEIIHSSGEVVVQIRLRSGDNNTDTAVANMNVYLHKCKLGADVNKIGGTLASDACDAANERTAVEGGSKTTAGNGTATWTGLEEGWYVATMNATTTDGVEYNVGGAVGDVGPQQVFQPSARPVTEYIQIFVPKS